MTLNEITVNTKIETLTVLDPDRTIDLIMNLDVGKILFIDILNTKLGDMVDIKIIDSENGIYQISTGVEPENIIPYKEVGSICNGMYLAENEDRNILKENINLLKDMSLQLYYQGVISVDRMIYVNYGIYGS